MNWHNIELMSNLILVANDIRSSHNVGALFRMCDGLGVRELILVGITPYPEEENDSRLPHLSKKITNQIYKTALGAESSVEWGYRSKLHEAVAKLKQQGFAIIALEQSTRSKPIKDYEPADNIALIVGNEVDGLSESELELVDEIVEIPMKGEKESHNVVTAAAIASYHLLNL